MIGSTGWLIYLYMTGGGSFMLVCNDFFSQEHLGDLKTLQADAQAKIAQWLNSCG